ncbi:NADH dehydrogenase [ubiquinone] 1 alpha subcomplex assembly factor 5-like protein [Dinothrombium tinctorium]|uniref:Arginine-hydroxylase NDUFAF5, mitochondrial n=1 Tax=Dinothrombium tinctorium TaxID=1965070 RepID=A0A3S3NVT9_9ACAR|nr:NADH dehydrogenase [ubiquinone] 1 alpha subcomplex assembly factor 5-like protein [Dinothrombium tinctorium]
MSKATKRKYVTKEVVDNYLVPEDPQQIVKVLASRGNNLHLVATESGEQFLVSMPTKFRRNVWIKRGDFVIVEPIEEGDKVKAEIVHILLKHQIKYIKDEGKWPKAFDDQQNVKEASDSEDELKPNPNRCDSSPDQSETSESSEESESSAAKQHMPRMKIFDRRMKTKQKDYFAQLDDAHNYEYLKEEFGFRLADKLFDIKRKFQVVVELGCGRGYISHHLENNVVDTYFACDTSIKSLENMRVPPDINFEKLLVDEEFIPFRENSVDAIVSSLSLHWVNYLPQTFLSVLNCLKKDGVFLGSLFGGQTLFELRSSLQLAEIEREGGFSPHISPFVETIDIGALLTRAGFTLLTIDTDEIKVSYPTIFELMTDLQNMAESNVALNRKLHLHRDTIIAAAAIYKEMYANNDGSIPATFQIFNFIGWKPDESQPKAAKRGSAEFSLKDIKDFEKILKNTEINEKKNV